MRIHKVTLKNFGGHKNLEVDLDAPVACVIGPNGSGKSNLMTAIDFAFRGSVGKRSQETFVRRGSDGNGSVDIEFSKGGVKGRIFRQVGKTPGRKLWWDGAAKPITKDVDVAKLMSEIVSCDKAAMEKIVFIRQGKLGEFLFETPAVREAELAAICQLDHLPAVADIVGQEINRITKEMVDNTAALDEANANRQKAEDALRTAESELELHPDCQAEIRWIESLSSVIGKFRDALVNYQQRLSDANMLVADPEYAGLADKLATVERELAESTEALVRAKAAETRSAELAGLIAAAKRAAALEQESRVRLDVLKPADELRTKLREAGQAVTGQKDAVAMLEANLAKQKAIAECESRHSRFSEELDKLRKQVAELGTPLTKEETEGIESERRDISLRLAGLDFVLKSCAGGIGHGCPVCSGTDLSSLPSPDVARSQKEQLLVKTYELDMKLSDNQALLHEIATLNGRVSHGIVVVGSEAERLAALPKPDFPVTDAQLEQAVARLRERERESADILVALAERDRLQAAWEAAAANVIKHEAVSEWEAEAEELVGKLEDVRGIAASIASLRSRRTALQDIASRIRAAEAELAKASEAYKTASETAMSACDKKAVERFGNLTADPSLSQNTLTVQLEETRSRQAERDRVTGVIQGHTQTLRAAENRIHEIERKEMANATRRSLISELEEVRGLFGRGGLQRAYLTRLFDILVEETQEALSVWEDDFNVIADPEQPFNFLFSRVNRPDDYMDQELLSGGQRLRLALSFIMGLQRVLYPGLNFMCADEPSNHMDAEGTEGLVRVFRQIGMESDSDSQVILVDHKPELLAAAGKVKVLPKLPAED